jgi:hypothetical protein
MKKYYFLFVVMALMFGCASVDVTKTAKGFYEPTNPNEVEILITGCDKPYIELGSVTVTGFAPAETAKMHNAIRAKAAELGANAVIIKNEGLVNQGLAGMRRWAMGAAIRYKENVK